MSIEYDFEKLCPSLGLQVYKHKDFEVDGYRSYHTQGAFEMYKHQQAEIATLKAENERYKLQDKYRGTAYACNNCGGKGFMSDCRLCATGDNTQGGNKNG